ncbi:MAG: response regulator transcription factor [Alphaproteobacteria bacterium]|nr:response regulator transcription factor [Alphaproteobacteria bacterium]
MLRQAERPGSDVKAASDRLVYVVDDDAGVRNALKFMLRAAGFDVELFKCARSFLNSYHPTRSGCLLVDFRMPGLTGLELIAEVNQRGWSLPIVLISAHANVPLAVDAVKAGAFDVIEKPLQPNDVIDRLERALSETDADRRQRLLRAQLESRLNCLTAREREVFAWIASGQPSKVIARQLGISFRTVEVHRSNIGRKLLARSPADLVRLASASFPDGSLPDGALPAGSALSGSPEDATPLD